MYVSKILSTYNCSGKEREREKDRDREREGREGGRNNNFIS